jgi:hypothetical protein
MVFIETSIFANQIRQIATDDEYRALQNVLLADPAAGKLISGGGGIRKIRFGRAGRGKSGGGRVIYYFLSARNQIYMLAAYPKSVKVDLSVQEISVLHDLAKALKRNSDG